MGLHAHDPDVGEHELLSDILEVGLVYDQLNAGEICIFELVARRYQLLEEIHAGQLAVAENAGTGYAGATHESDERFIFLGQTRGRSIALVSPDLAEFVANTLKERALVLKERRKARDERQSAEAADEPARRHRNRRGRGRGAAEGQV